MDQLTTTRAVMDALGGARSVAELTGRKYPAAHAWYGFDTFPPDTFLVMTAALAEKRKAAPISLWRMVEPAAAEESAA